MPDASLFAEADVVKPTMASGSVRLLIAMTHVQANSLLAARHQVIHFAFSLEQSLGTFMVREIVNFVAMRSATAVAAMMVTVDALAIAVVDVAAEQYKRLTSMREPLLMAVTGTAERS